MDKKEPYIPLSFWFHKEPELALPIAYGPKTSLSKEAWLLAVQNGICKWEDIPIEFREKNVLQPKTKPE